jgi:putative CocE/NonD family hydrolase
MKTTIVLFVAVLGLCAAIPCAAAAQAYPFPSAAVDDPAAMRLMMPQLAKALLASYADSDHLVYLDNLFRLQIVAGQFDAAAASLAALRRFNDDASPWSATNYSQYVIFVNAKRLQASGMSFDRAFETSFHRAVDSESDAHAALIVRRFLISTAPLQADLQLAVQRQSGESTISQDNALTLVRDYQNVDMYQAFATRAASLIANDDRRRYIIQNDLLIRMRDGAQICTLVVRPRARGRDRLPALLQFTIYADRIPNFSDARRSASNGYAGVEALTRGKGCSPDSPVPYVHDGSDAAAVIDWIARQPWSDGRVGMFGGSYNSFVQWATAKRAPRALKSLMTSVSNAPGIDTPMENNVFQSFSYDWPFYTMTSKWLDASTQGDPTHWIGLQKKWYISGKPYRSMDRIDGRPNPIWDRWLDHPSYDAYWQQFIPYREDFARIDLPLLSTDGYLAGQNVGGLYYFTQYTHYNPRAPAYFVVGPYDHVRGQRGTVSSLGRDLDVVAGDPIDAAAHIDIESLRYQWFDYIFKGARKPAILDDRVNYEVMGANEWRHAPSVQAMHDELLTFHLDATDDGGFHRLTQAKTAADAFVSQTVDLADRTDANGVPAVTGLDTHLGVAYQSAPFRKPVDLVGVFSGQLDFVTNKKDFDINISLYELTAKHEYVGVTYYQARASYVRSRTQRELLVPGMRTRLAFTSSRLASWRFHAGSRLVVLVSVVKEPDIQINYGTGKDVSDESIADAKVPLKIQWFADSFVTMPAWR